MEHLYSAQPLETVSLEVEFSVVWEVILGIAGYTHKQLRHTFDLDQKWEAEQKSMPDSLTERLKLMEETNLWYGLIMLQNKFSSSSVQQFSNQLSKMQIECFYELLLPYKDRHTEPIRRATVKQCNKDSIESYADYFKDHDYLGGYIRSLGQYPHQEICDLFTKTLDEWYKWVSRRQEWDTWMQALAFEQKQHGTLDHTNPIEEISRVTGGIKYIPEPSVWTVKLIPHVSYRPWILEKRTADTKLFFYPLKEEYLLEPGVPSSDLIRGHKALGDELRLKLLYQLCKGPSSLQELSIQFKTSKTSLHHQLSLLKAAKFIRVDKGVYSANSAQINSFSGKLNLYLGDHA